MKNELDLEIISKSFSNLSKATEIPVKVLSPAVHEYQKEFEMQPVMDGQLPKFCKAHTTAQNVIRRATNALTRLWAECLELRRYTTC